MTTSCSLTLVAKSRLAWAREGGARRRYTQARVQQALQRRRRAGWLSCLPADGHRHERLAVLHFTHPLASIARQYNAGVRCFEQCLLEQLLDLSLATGTGVDRLARAGFGIVQVSGSVVELRATDPRVARLVNRSRIGTPDRGRDAYRVIHALLALPPKTQRRRSLTDDRRLAAALRLQEAWSIDCDDLIDFRPRVRLVSRWTLRQAACRRVDQRLTD